MRRRPNARSSAATAASALAVLAGVAACTSPGKPVANHDVRFFGGVGASPAQPAAGQSTTIAFNVFNVDRTKSFDAAPWRVYADPVDPAVPTGGTLVASGVASVGINAYVAQQAVIAPLSPGTHQLYLVIDPDAATTDVDRGDNVLSFPVTWADLDVAFAAYPGVAVPTLDASGNISLAFAITNIANAGGAQPTAHVSYAVQDAGVPVTAVSTSPSPPVTVAAGATVPVTVVLPSSPGTHAYTVVLTSDVVEANLANDSATVVVGIGAHG